MRAGIVGVGFMSWIHYLAYQRSEQAELVAFCSRDPKKRAGDWRGIHGNFGPPGEQIDVSSMNVYEGLDSMLADESIDLIDICLPPALHPDAIGKCFAAGKKVLCEKPLALSARTAHALASQAAPGQLLVAHILPFMPEFQLLVDAANDGRWGKPIAGRFKRTISPPDWIPDFYDSKRVGGPLIDLHVHDAHLIRLLFGMPTAAHTVSRPLKGVPQFYESVFEFADSQLAVSAGGGVINSPARGFTHGYEVSFERATVQFEFAAYADGSTALIPLTIMHADGTVERPELGDGDPVSSFVAEINAAAESVDTGKHSPILDATIAADALTICEMQQ
ncbi:Gfo/Idh/MocA family protein [Stieleria varia]|uniref:Inositol 2-dehydrogenase n=1 Tax=Stieleria varia TaxID=2528005 RepID=A0A5C6A0G8_9BACT|nr:Gfo/Idh/MocA family oxidoreductase [Stieleria varia]TWT92033.1 Inositol 2-dehydrogenase [Stieleria varia]